MNNLNDGDDNFNNPMVSHYKNPDLNAFEEEGLSIDVIKENTRLWLSVPQSLKKHAIHNIMKQFGHVTNIHIPFDLSRKSSRLFAFVEYSTFKEAEKALRELNSSKNQGLEIRAEFAHAKSDKNTSVLEAIPQNSTDAGRKKEPEEDIPEIPITVNFDSSESDDVIEKITAFEYSGPEIADFQDDQHKRMKQLAEKSLGEYIEDEDCFQYNMKLKEYNFLTYYCCVCDNEAMLIKNEKPARYFCTKECADFFYKTKSDKNETEGDVKQYQVQKSDRVCITAIINEKCFYVRRSDEDLNFLLETIYRKSSTAQPLQMLPEENHQVMILKDETFFRAEVLEIDYDESSEISITAKLIDIGSTVTVPITHVFEMNSECMKINKITTKIMLKNVEVEAINVDVTEYLLKLLHNNVELAVEEVDEKGVVLKEVDSNTIINEEIIKLANFDKVDFNNDNSLSLAKDLVPAGDGKQRLFVVNFTSLRDLGWVVCVAEKYVKDFLEMYRSLNMYGKKVDPNSYGISGSKPVCLVKYNDQWHRGILQEAKGDGKPRFVLYDLQFECIINIKNVFPLPTVLEKFQIVSEIYEIDGFNTNEDVKNYCENKIFENDYIIAEKVEIKDGKPYIHIKMTHDEE